MKLAKERIRNIILFIFLIFVLSFLSGCGSNYVSEKTILEDLKRDELFSVHSVEIENFEIIKRLSNEEQDSIFVNVKGRNSIYSISLNYKMVYLPYNDGWLIETIEQYEDSGEFVNEIMPLQGPTQEDIDYFTSTVDWESYSSYDKRYVKESKWEIIDNGLLELDNDYGRASFLCKIVYKYTFVQETVTFPVFFNFTEVDSDGTRGWYAYENDSVDVIERQVDLTDEICGDWYCEYNFTPLLSVKSLSYNIDLTISSVTSKSSADGKSETKLCAVDNYVYSDDETFKTSGTMQLIPYFNKEDGKISSLKLCWVDGDYNHPNKCQSLYFSTTYFYTDAPNTFSLVSAYKPSYGLNDYTLVLRKK